MFGEEVNNTGSTWVCETNAVNKDLVTRTSSSWTNAKSRCKECATSCRNIITGNIYYINYLLTRKAWNFHVKEFSLDAFWKFHANLCYPQKSRNYEKNVLVVLTYSNTEEIMHFLFEQKYQIKSMECKFGFFPIFISLNNNFICNYQHFWETLCYLTRIMTNICIYSLDKYV